MIDPISAAAINPSSVNQQYSQNLADSSTLSTSWSSGPEALTIRATDMAPGPSVNPLSSEAFENLSTNVHGGLENLKSANAHSSLQIESQMVTDQMKTMAPSFDSSGNDVSSVGKKDAVQDAMETLEKTFDHAVFSAMVTQVASGVSNSVRMLARQS